MDLKQDLIGTELNGYRITHCIGEGGMAYVFRAENVIDPKIIRALKMIKPEFSEQEDLFDCFTQEARILEGLNHPNIVKFHGLRKASEFLWMELEFLDGKSFAHSYFDKKKIPLDQALGWIYESVSAVAYAHTKKIIHRDIKPANLFLTNQNEIKVLDFGIAKILNQISGQQKSIQKNQATAQQPSRLFASPAYMAPEVCQGEQPTEASDVYALCVIFFQWIMGRHPLISPQSPPKTSVQMMLLHIENQIPPLRQVIQATSMGLETVFLKASAQNPKQRYANAYAFLEDLHLHLFDRPLDPPKPTTLTIPQIKINHLDTPVSLKAIPKEKISIPSVGPTAVFFSDLPISNQVLPQESPYESKNQKPTYKPIIQEDIPPPQDSSLLLIHQELEISEKKGGINPKLNTTPEGMILGFEIEKPSRLKFHILMFLLILALSSSLIYMVYHTQINHLLISPPPKNQIEWIDIHAIIPHQMLSKTEITVGQYRMCVKEQKCEIPQRQSEKGKCTWTDEADDWEQRPINCIHYQDALDFAQFAQSRLPTKDEWLQLIKHQNQNFSFPWGNEISCEYAVIYEKGPACQKDQMPLETCSITKGNHLGICDLIGNTWEWILNTPIQNTSKKALTLGGGYYTDAPALQLSLEKERNIDHIDSSIGFRLIKNKVDKPLSE